MTDFEELVSAIRQADELSTTSLSQYTKPTIIESPTFIQDKILDEDICGNLLSNLYNLYVSYILVALKLNERIDSSTTVRDFVSTVSSSSSIASMEFLSDDLIVDGFGKNIASTESIDTVDSKKTPAIPSGRLFEFEILNDCGKQIKMYLNVNFQPRYFPTEVVEYIVSTNFNESIHNRWLRMKAGELKFFHDFLFNLDILDKRAKALRNDRDNALKDIFRHGNKSSIRQILDIVMKKKSFNLANATMILDEGDADKYAKKYSMDFSKPSDRQKFFNKTFCLFLVLVDTQYSMVTIYTNAINHGATYKYRELESNNMSGKVDINTMMEFISKNQMPKF